MGPHARLRRVSWSPDDPAAVDRLARDLVLVVANKPTLAVLRNANTSSPHSRLAQTGKSVTCPGKQFAEYSFAASPSRLAAICSDDAHSASAGSGRSQV